MGLDITIREVEAIRCPDCGRLVATKTIDDTYSGGRVWYDILEEIGYYVPYEARNENNDWYGKDMTLTDEQVKNMLDFAEQHQPQNDMAVKNLLARAIVHGNQVVINADW